MAEDSPPKSDDDLVRGSLSASPSPDLLSSLSPWENPLRQATLVTLPQAIPASAWESPLRQAANASQLRGSSARPLPSSGPTRAAEPEKPVTPGFAVWRSPASFGSPRAQSDAEAPSPPVVSGVQEGLVRRATQTAPRAILGAGAVDGLLATRNEKKPPTRELWQESLDGAETCAGKPRNMGGLSDLIKAEATSCDCSPCQGGTSIPEVRNDFFDGKIQTNKTRKQKKINKKTYMSRTGSCQICGHDASVVKVKNAKTRAMKIEGEPTKRTPIRPPNKQPDGSEIDWKNIQNHAQIIDDPGGWSRARHGVLLKTETEKGTKYIRVVPTGLYEEPTYYHKNSKTTVDSNINSFPEEILLDNSDDSLADLMIKNGVLVPSKSYAVGVNGSYLWDNGIIPYEWDSDEEGWDGRAALQGIIHDAMFEWEYRTNNVIQFSYHPESDINPFDTSSVELIYEDDEARSFTYSYTSSIPWGSNASKIEFGNLSDNTNVPFIYDARHELGHVIGLAHEQQRSDRNLYHNYTFISKNYSPDFAIRTDNLPVGPYNGRSIMQYSTSINGCNPPPIDNTEEGWIPDPDDLFSDPMLLACASCLPQWVPSNVSQFPQNLFCPSPNPNQLSLGRFITLLDGSGVVEMYRYHQHGIQPFTPFFDFYPEPTIGNGTQEFLTAGDSFASGTPAVTKINGTDDLVVVVTSASGKVYIRKYDSTKNKWDTWEYLHSPPGGAFSDPAVVSRPPIQKTFLDIFVTNNQGELYYLFYTPGKLVGGSYEWQKVDGAKVSMASKQIAQPAAISLEYWSVDIFINSPGTKDNPFPSIKTCNIGAGSSIDTNIKWSYIPTDNFLVASGPSATTIENGQFVLTVSGVRGTPPAQNRKTVVYVVRQVDEEKKIIITQTNNSPIESIWIIRGSRTPTPGYNDKIGDKFFGPWNEISGQVGLVGSRPAVASAGAGRYAVYIRGDNGHLMRRWYKDGRGWDPNWWDLGGVLASDPGVYKNIVIALVGESTISNTQFVQIQNINEITSMNLGLWFKRDVVGLHPSETNHIFTHNLSIFM